MNSPHLSRIHRSYICRIRALSVKTKTTTATAPPGVSYLHLPYAAVHHDTGFSHRKLQPENPKKSASHASNYNSSSFHAFLSYFAQLILFSILIHSYTLQIDTTINNLLIPPDDPRGHPLTITRKPGPAYPPTAI